MMDRAEAIKRLSLHLMQCSVMMPFEWVKENGIGSEFMEAYKMAIAALQEKETERYTIHEVAVILAEFTGDNCACNFNGIDGWLPEKCELQDACPNTAGVACWEQYLKYRMYEPPKEGAEK